MAETITLPRSGAPALVERDEAHIWEVRTTTCNVLLGYSTNREQAILNADEDALKIRAALLPADARERVAKVLKDRGIVCGGNEEEDRQALIAADAVLAALGVRP